MSESPIDIPAIASDAVDFHRRHTVAVLRVDREFRPARYVRGTDGSPVIFGPPSLLDTDSVVLFIPADEPGALELMVSPQREDGQSAEADRWRIYHGRADEPLCLRLTIEAGKFRGEVFDGESLTRANPCAAFEPAVCRWMNTDHRGDLIALCWHFNRVEVDEALLVGLDPTGFDIRAKVGIIRIDSDTHLNDETRARTVLESLCRIARGGSP